MANNEIHWGEGLFLRPHHFQASQRHLQESIRVAENWNVGYAYGLRKIELDEDALANWRISLKACDIRLHDGSHIRVPENANLSPISIPKESFPKQDSRVLVHLALPRLQMGTCNASASASGDCRYGVQLVEIEDENAPGNPQQLEVRRANVRLIIGGRQEVAGYDALPLLRLRLGATAEAPPEIDPDYIPPLLACNAWPILQSDFLVRIYDYLGSKAEILAEQMTDRGVAFESGHREDLERILKLHSVNSSLGYLSQLPFAQGVHPFTAYCELCRAVGLFAIFDSRRRMPNLPLYDHDDLGTCFRAVRQILVGDQAPPKYLKRPFVCAGFQLQVHLDREWLEPSWAFYIGIESRLSFSEVQALLLTQLDMKVGSSEEVDRIYLRGASGVSMKPEPDPPRDFPHAKWSFWRVDRSSEPWKAVERSLSLGIRFNERQVEGWTNGDQNVQITDSRTGKPVTVSFALYAMQTR